MTSNTCHYQCISFHPHCAGLSLEELRWLHLQLHAADTESYTPTITSAPNLEEPETNGSAPVQAGSTPVLVRRPSSFRALNEKYNAPESSSTNSTAEDKTPTKLLDTSMHIVSPGRSTASLPAPTDSLSEAEEYLQSHPSQLSSVPAAADPPISSQLPESALSHLTSTVFGAQQQHPKVACIEEADQPPLSPNRHTDPSVPGLFELRCEAPVPFRQAPHCAAKTDSRGAAQPHSCYAVVKFEFEARTGCEFGYVPERGWIPRQLPSGEQLLYREGELPFEDTVEQAWLANEESEFKCPSPPAALRIDIVCLDSFRESEDATPVTPGTPVSPIGDWVEADLLRVSGDMHNSSSEDRIESMV